MGLGVHDAAPISGGAVYSAAQEVAEALGLSVAVRVGHVAGQGGPRGVTRSPGGRDRHTAYVCCAPLCVFSVLFGGLLGDRSEFACSPPNNFIIDPLELIRVSSSNKATS